MKFTLKLTQEEIKLLIKTMNNSYSEGLLKWEDLKTLIYLERQIGSTETIDHLRKYCPEMYEYIVEGR